MHESAELSPTSLLSSVDSAIEVMRNGGLVIIVDDEDRENEGDFVVAAEHMTPEIMNTLITDGRGLVCCSMHGSWIDRLGIPMMVPDQRNSSGFGTGFTCSVEASEGVTTGISAADRSHTVRTLANPNSTSASIAMPGHIFPLRAKDGGVLERRGQTEASVDLAILAGLRPAAVICEMLREDGEMMRLPEILVYADAHNIPVISVEALANYRVENEQLDNEQDDAANHPPQRTPHVRFISKSTLPTPQGVFDITVYRDLNGLEHSLLSMGDLAAQEPLVRLHSECLTGDVFDSKRCDCGNQLQNAMSAIGKRGHGAGMDTVDANIELGFPADARSYEVAADMLRHQGVTTVQLMTNNPVKIDALTELGITVSERIPLIVPANKTNEHYLHTKADRMGHQLK